MSKVFEYWNAATDGASYAIGNFEEQTLPEEKENESGFFPLKSPDSGEKVGSQNNAVTG